MRAGLCYPRYRGMFFAANTKLSCLMSSYIPSNAIKFVLSLAGPSSRVRLPVGLKVIRKVGSDCLEKENYPGLDSEG